MAKQPAKVAALVGPSFGTAIAAFVAAVGAVAVSPYTPIAASTQEALDKAGEDLVAAAGALSGGAAAVDPADLKVAIEKAVTDVLAAQREDLVGQITEQLHEKLSSEIQTGLDALKASLPDAVKTEVGAQKAELADELAELKGSLLELVKAEVTAQLPPPQDAG